MKKKSILIINKSFEAGGIQTALANLLDEIHETYDVSLAVFYPVGPLKDRVPENVKMLKLSPLVKVLGMNGGDLENASFVQKLFKLGGGVWSKVFGNTLPVKLAMLFQKNAGEYDVVISYHQETSAKTLVTGFGEFALKKCRAKKRIAWVHADFLATKLATKKNLATYKKFDKIVCVSENCMNNFVEAYPELSDKCDYCYNSVPQKRIAEMSLLEKDVFKDKDESTVLFSACRLVEEKGIVPAAQNLLSLWENGYNIKWYIAGDGPERKKIEELINKYELSDKLILLGFKSNPYPYMKEADFLFLPSLHETFSMVVSEAHVLGTPVIASDIPIMREVTGEYDYLCQNGNYADCIKNIMAKTVKNKKYAFDNIGKCQFERIIDNC